ncbi:460_t:CDS:10, partial [Paraglomus occultum]
NQWARISSLWVRKSQKQCKARWYEWLDPSIKKTEWSKEEDEKLLHLAKLMPTQWRTIAPIVGRTPSQCLERYQKLLDEAEAKEGADLGLTGPSGDVGPSADDVRRLRPGEIDPDPETKPARPDPVDMDEDEKEMLSEARARLANTQGKKAKRKAREKQLEEARRLASLQKRRELKAAGIELKTKKKKKGMDYKADIPFEKRPALGFYDTSAERNRPAESAMTNVALQKLELNKIKQAEQISKRRKFVLPAPQVGEDELEQIVKIGFAGETAKAVVGENEGSTSLGHYTPATTLPLRTPRTVRTGGAPTTPKTPGTVMTLRTPSRTPGPASAAAIKQLKTGLGRGRHARRRGGASDRDRKLRELQAAEERARLARRSQAVRNLPRPATVNSRTLWEISTNESAGMNDIELMICGEMSRLLSHDLIKYPVAGSKITGSDSAPPIEEFPDELMAIARQTINDEYQSLIQNNGSDTQDRLLPSDTELQATWTKVYDDINNEDNTIEKLQYIHEMNKNNMLKYAQRASKLEKNLDVTLGGYKARSQALSKKLLETFDELQQSKIELDSFKSLNIVEGDAMPRRIAGLQKEVEDLAKRERELQERYAKLSAEKEDAIQRVNALRASSSSGS